MFKKENGITLIALVVTIIVLLILAGVSISMVVGNNGVATKAKDAAEKTERAEVQTAVDLAVASLETYYWGEYAEGKDPAYAFKEFKDSLNASGYEVEGEYYNYYDYSIIRDGDTFVISGDDINNAYLVRFDLVNGTLKSATLADGYYQGG